jgi:hypothetical protein
MKPQEDAIDPITAINLEFARQAERSWSSEPTEHWSEQATPVLRTRLVARLRTLVGARLVATGLLLQGQNRELDTAIGRSRAQIGQ